MPTYFLRTNTVVLVDANGHATYVERTMEEDATDPDEAEWRLNTFEFDVIQETDDCEDHVTNDHVTNDTAASAKKNLTNGTTVNERDRDESTPERANHPKKRRLTNGTSSPVEPAKKVIVKE